MSGLIETKRIALGATLAPIDLTVDPDIGSVTPLGATFQKIAIQNVSSRTIVRYRESIDPPAAGAMNTGHTLPAGGGLVVLLAVGLPFWCWAAGSAEIAVSSAGPVGFP